MAKVSGGEGADHVEGVRSAVDRLCEELKSLNRRVDGLTAAVERLQHGDTGPAAEAPGPAKAAGQPTAARAPARIRMERATILIGPLPELAMAAMAETSLRDLPGVGEVVSSERFDDRARFTLEVAAGTDLIAEMRQAMPVEFKVIEPGPEEISIELHWAWGTPG